MLVLSDQESKTSMVNVLRTLMDKFDSVQEETGHDSRETEILRNNQK